MAKPAKIIVLCEGGTDAAFIRRFLKLRGYTGRYDIEFKSYPDGKGSGAEFVRKEFPKELQGIRKRQGVGLIACTDEDTLGQAHRKQEIDAACREAGIPVKNKNDPAMIAEPARNMEVWFHYLLGGLCDDERKDYPKLKDSEIAKECARKLHQYCYEAQKLPEPAPQSLKDACEEWKRMNT